MVEYGKLNQRRLLDKITNSRGSSGLGNFTSSTTFTDEQLAAAWDDLINMILDDLWNGGFSLSSTSTQDLSTNDISNQTAVNNFNSALSQFSRPSIPGKFDICINSSQFPASYDRYCVKMFDPFLPEEVPACETGGRVPSIKGLGFEMISFNVDTGLPIEPEWRLSAFLGLDSHACLYAGATPLPSVGPCSQIWCPESTVPVTTPGDALVGVYEIAKNAITDAVEVVNAIDSRALQAIATLLLAFALLTVFAVIGSIGSSGAAAGVALAAVLAPAVIAVSLATDGNVL